MREIREVREVSTDQLESAAIPTGTLVVTVVAEGEAVSGRVVSVREAVPDSAEAGLTTDERGQATFTLPGGKEYRLSTSIEPDVSSAQGSVLVPADQVTEYSFAFHRIFGHITNMAGDPVKHRPLSVRMSTPVALPDDDLSRGPRLVDARRPVNETSGEFQLLAAPGTYLLECLEHDEPRGQQRVTVRHAAIHVSITLFAQA